jgi:hypothetical protein
VRDFQYDVTMSFSNILYPGGGTLPTSPGYVYVTYDVTFINHTKSFQAVNPRNVLAVKSAGGVQSAVGFMADTRRYITGGCYHWPPDTTPANEKPRGGSAERKPDGSDMSGVSAGGTWGPVCILAVAAAGHPRGVTVIFSSGAAAQPRPKGFRPYEIRVT